MIPTPKRRCRPLVPALALALALLGPAARAEPEASPPSTALPQDLSLADAERLFRAQGLDLLLAEVEVNAARAEVQLAGALPNPQVGFQIGKVFGYDTQDPVVCPGGGCSAVAWSVALSDGALSDAISGRRGLRLQAARAALSAAQRSRADAERLLLFQVRQQYLSAVLYRQLHDFAREVVVTAQKTVELNRVRFRTGAISEADLAKAETAALEAEQTENTAAEQLRVAKVGLAFLLGVRGPAPDYRVTLDSLKGPAPASLQRPSSAELFRLALSHRPDLQANAAQRDRAEASLRLARRQNVPDFQVQAQLNQAGTGPNAPQPPTFTAGLNVALPLFNQHRGDIARARADQQQQDLLRRKLEAQISSDVETALAAVVATQRRLQRMEGQLLSRARRARDLIAFQYEKGAASLLEYLDAQRTYIAINQEYFQDLTAYRTALYQLEQAMGTELP